MPFSKLVGKWCLAFFSLPLQAATLLCRVRTILTGSWSIISSLNCFCSYLSCLSSSQRLLQLRLHIAYVCNALTIFLGLSGSCFVVAELGELELIFWHLQVFLSLCFFHCWTWNIYIIDHVNSYCHLMFFVVAMFCSSYVLVLLWYARESGCLLFTLFWELYAFDSVLLFAIFK